MPDLPFRIPVWLAAGIAGFALAVIVILAFPGSAEPPPSLDEGPKLAACRAETMGLLKPASVDVILLNDVANFCYGRVRGEDLLGDFNIRRTNYLRQQYQGKVFLWMVVTITLSGVFLAGVQLLAAYHLAVSDRGSFDQGGEVTIEQKRLSLKSSVTGLLILTVSFAFFLVFVVWVYPLTPSNIRLEDADQTPKKQAILDGGGLGGPPPNQSAPEKTPAPAEPNVSR